MEGFSLDLGLYWAGNYRTGHLPRRGLVDFRSSQISPILGVYTNKNGKFIL